MAYEFRYQKLVEFSETDLAGILHFSNLFRYMEMAEHAFYRSLGLSVLDDALPGIGWPRVQAECVFTKPLRFEDNVQVHLFVMAIKEKSISYAFVISKLSGNETLEAARGNVTAVCVRFDKDSDAMKSTLLPKVFREKIEVAPNKVLDQYSLM